MKLTKREIDALPATAQGRDRIFFDDTIPGFGLRITPAGVQSFLFQYQPGGRTGPKRRVMLGRYGEVTPDQARRAAEQLRHRVRAGPPSSCAIACAPGRILLANAAPPGLPPGRPRRNSARRR